MRWLHTNFDLSIAVTAAIAVSSMVMTFVWGLVLDVPALIVISGIGAISGAVLAFILSFLPDDMRSFETERILRIATALAEDTRNGLTAESAQRVCALLLPETRATAIALTDRETVLAYVGERDDEFPVGTPIRTQATFDVLQSGQLATFDSITPFDILAGTPLEESTKVAGIVAPLIVHDVPIGTIKLYYARPRDINRTQLSIARGFSELLSSQLAVYALDRQAELTAQAEVKALQAQINPHFLFNTINTIAAFTRTDPERARNLLRDFAVFYRRTLEYSSEQLIPLERELEQTRRYLLFEHARFGDDRILMVEHVEEGCDEVPVPSFLIQPIVENSVRHAMGEEDPLHIDVYVLTEDNDVLISISDDGVGMPQSVADTLIETSGASQEGTGIALRNIAGRIKQFYGPGSNVEIVSREGVGTCVTMRLAGAAPQAQGNQSVQRSA
jgi:two-component system sensor histidine kinase LytS